jgi:hypothetical protein
MALVSAPAMPLKEPGGDLLRAPQHPYLTRVHVPRTLATTALQRSSLKHALAARDNMAC